MLTSSVLFCLFTWNYLLLTYLTYFGSMREGGEEKLECGRGSADFTGLEQLFKGSSFDLGSL